MFAVFRDGSEEPVAEFMTRREAMNFAAVMNLDDISNTYRVREGGSSNGQWVWQHLED